MGSSSHRRRREHRFRRYLKAGRLSKAQSLFQRHPQLDIDAGRPPPLHRACAHRDAPALRLLLHLGADPTRQDCHGNTALHAAARLGPRAYKDFFLPLMTQCPTAMKMKNKQGETPGELLGWETPPDPSVEVEEEEEEAYRERKWRQKLQEEQEDEWQEMMGRFEGDEDATLNIPEPESFSAWIERLAREYAQKRRQKQATERAQHPKRMSASYHSWQQQEKECRLFQEQAKAKEEELRESRAKKAQEARGHCGGDPQKTKPRGRDRFLCFEDIPWPCLGGRDPEAMAAALMARGPPPTDQGALRKYLRAQQVQWHPDRFLQRFGGQIEAREREKVMEIVTALSQALNRHAEGLK
ncbi:NF-kappa-B inhibitor-like protein 1 [Dromiciops gliroides]|uniref:NF-kappa-B inhibitor-like protein 1 n=1 Tax=Dromiciops gliroides TaxID=33562 RepID=UPI001CC63340|nr:NF-kappa-B inhibitor-like protein 1 [Dromiciops gliroides]XP_043820241.1 NF-kappa-B inhibitor-like protein 1 [Dromiciops gliroides]XP_043820242.1 NF-kappa-B inhibitor-like protein 1 [Dromiciops gliroides]XP_043820243.1 NF-kappa-B inhibitor-like protein 1 [Dromiciops gliroides]XP_043820244.1 NF-kappa-B inhibitor-like protein 1 [Dromiciops gliroides]